MRLWCLRLAGSVAVSKTRGTPVRRYGSAPLPREPTLFFARTQPLLARARCIAPAKADGRSKCPKLKTAREQMLAQRHSRAGSNRRQAAIFGCLMGDTPPARNGHPRLRTSRKTTFLSPNPSSGSASSPQAARTRKESWYWEKFSLGRRSGPHHLARATEHLAKLPGGQPEVLELPHDTGREMRAYDQYQTDPQVEDSLHLIVGHLA